MINDIYSYLNTQLAELTGGTNLFKSRLTDKPDDQVVVFATGGQSPDHYLPTADMTFQVYVRSTSYANGWSLVEKIVDALHQKTNEELVLGGTYFYYIFLLNEPAHIGQDEKGRHEFSINFQTHTQR